MQLITDQIFIDYLRTIGVEVIDGVAQNPEDTTEIDIEDLPVSDLSGIGQFRNLRELACNGTSISSLDLSENLALERLFCAHTPLVELDLSSNLALRVLYCMDAPLNTLDLSANTALEMLACSDTSISALDLSKNKRLEQLYCYRTPLAALDLSNNPAFGVLYCSDTNIPLWQPTASGIFFAKPNDFTYLLRPDGTVIAGCFCGTLEEFEKRALREYGNDTTKNYQPEIERLKQIAQNP